MIFDAIGVNLEQNLNTPDYLADINEDTVSESPYEPTLEGTMMHILEAEENWNAFQQAVALTELQGFRESGDIEYVLEAEQGESFFTKAINWFRSLFSKAVQTFKKFVNYMASKVASDKHFIKKFEAIKNSLEVPAGFKFKGYKFTTENQVAEGAKKATGVCRKYFDVLVSANVENDRLKSILDKVKSNKKSIEDEIRSAAILQSGKVTPKEFTIELKKLFRNGSMRPSEISVSKADIDAYFNVVKSHKGAVDEANKALKAVKDTTNKAIDDVKKAKAEVKKVDDKSKKSLLMSYANAQISMLKTVNTVVVQVNGALIGALNQENSQAKSVLYSLNAVNGKKKESKKEDNKQTSTNESFFLDNLEYL